ncbi:hypothetical protein PHYBLDRAFT_159686 [Phycomyces blakesleeanus NRRL 1555(-)]|uniref:PCI domain-containing protein n=2 Tax=Phycomyces blakesleeanus TaxID=4837 RepID=A0A162PKS9_PHYB8|nr:hypothetical protein PHYBLDRAFT_159686 [Phycomyces blakesleeanus NRRL 1555(-)]OAD69816.1 hypothetical protein PHYBLDRAFT_159686 [Phycomyces blakesleeanus NRRL 1555(-)]|eukprot:XP_018287856.1 hypothetical protein PHYBLDRAFT_159686 [Phycomyces blakesleeanus NRRL 1555(-)]
MWVALIEKAAKIKNKDDPTQWEPIVDLLRALREGIYASQWSEGDLEFSVKVFEQSTICCIQANNSDELLKSMRVLVDELYQIPNVVPKNYYRALYCLFLAFHDRTSGLDRINEISAHLPESKFVKAVVYCVIVAEDPIQFFALYNDCPDRYFKLLMDTYMDKIRLLSINILSKAYMRVPISFAAHCLGLSDIKKTVPTIERLVKPTCIDRVDLDTSTIYFIRKKADKK